MAELLDCQGLNCPEPVVRSKQLLESKHPVEVDVLVDNPASKENVTRFWEKNGYEVSAAVEKGTCTRLSCVRKREVSAVVEPTLTNCELGKTVVLITTETLGRGDDDLGTKLMANFLGSLSEITGLWRVILLNGGVKLAAQEGAALTALKKLAAGGVGIMVCGTCLGHYQLLEAKQVGETTNMLDIVSALSLANKVIRP